MTGDPAERSFITRRWHGVTGLRLRLADSKTVNLTLRILVDAPPPCR